MEPAQFSKKRDASDLVRQPSGLGEVVVAHDSSYGASFSDVFL